MVLKTAKTPLVTNSLVDISKLIEAVVPRPFICENCRPIQHVVCDDSMERFFCSVLQDEEQSFLVLVFTRLGKEAVDLTHHRGA